MEQEVSAEPNAANPQASAPTKNAVAAEPMKKGSEETRTQSCCCKTNRQPILTLLKKLNKFLTK